MPNVSINLTLKEYHKIVELLQIAYDNTKVKDDAVDIEKIHDAHAHIFEVLIKLNS